MTVANQTNRIAAVGNAAIGQEVPFSFPITSTSDVLVKKRITATGVETLLTETTNYTVVIHGDIGGTLTTVTAIETTEQIHIIRNTPRTQSLDLEPGGSFNAENVEDALDKNTKLAIENKDAIGKAIIFPATDASLLTTILPNAIDGASKVVARDSSGNITMIDAVPEGSVAFSTFGTNMAEAANALAGKAVINLDHVIDVRDYGGVADGSTDTTTGLQDAIDAANAGTTKRVYFPAGASYYKITTELTLYAGIRYFGDGVGSQIRQVTSDGNVLAASNQDDLIINDLYLYGPGDTGASTTGNGIYLSNCDYAKIYNIKTANMGLTGIQLRNCDYGRIKNNIVTASGKDSTGAAGILLYYSSSYNHIEGNIILDDGQGIWLATISAGDYSSYNTIIGNTIKTCDRYGIALYNTALAGYMHGNQIIGNTIRDISDVTAGSLGAGIYCNGIKYSTISGNYIENTNQGTTADTLAPGGIGVIGNNVVIANNTIQNAQWYGITVKEAGAAGGSHYTISNNNISDSVKAGIYASKPDNINIVGNLVQGGDAQGILVTGAGSEKNLVVTDNICVGDDGVEINITGYDYVKIANNIASDSVSSHGLYVATCDYVTILNNIINDNAVRGITFASTNTYVTVHNNICIGNDYGVLLTAVEDIVDFKDNIVTGSLTTNWTKAPFATFTDSDATPSLKGGRLFNTNTTGVTITRFDDVIEGQEFTIISKGAIVFDTSSATRLTGSSVDITTASGDITFWVCITGGTAASVCQLRGFVDVSADNSGGA